MSKSLDRKIANNKLWQQYFRGRSKKAAYRDELIQRYMPLVRYIVHKIAATLPPSVSRDDLMSVGSIGLIAAIDRYDPERKVAFETFARPRIYGAVLDELRSGDWLPRSMRQKAKKVDRAFQAIEVRKGGRPGVPEVAAKLDMAENEVHLLVARVLNHSMQSLDATVYDGGEHKEIRLVDTIRDRHCPDPVHDLGTRQMSELLGSTVRNLPAQERLVIVLYYYERLNLKEIGAILHLSESRISQIHSKAIAKLKTRMRNASEDRRLLLQEEESRVIARI